jgi:spore germination cell wall hydrolase CwlJ-like protein
MRRRTGAFSISALAAALSAALLQACTGHSPESPAEQAQSGQTAKVAAYAAERNCLVRAMYFESNRSSHDGLMAVGTVVMNRVSSPLYPNTICGVVGAPQQFAPGVLTRAMNERELPPVERAADAVLKGERYAPVGGAMHFHVAGLEIPYQVRYVATAGGNSFYLKMGHARQIPAPNVVLAAVTTETQAMPAVTPQPTLFARLYASLAGGEPAKTCDTSSSAFAPAFACSGR